jgi:acetyl-CoA carboxylase biotin carboxyl carrier protein
MKLSEIQDLIKFVARSGVTEVEIEQANFKITIKSDPTKKKGKAGQQAQQQAEAYIQPQMPVAMPQMMPQQPVAQPQPAPEPQKEKEEEKKEDTSNLITIKSPMIGTFYRSSGPDKDPFISVGDEVKKGKVVCIIEAMKLFNEIESEVAGKVVKVLVDDATPVEYDQPLFLIDPS